MDGLALIELSKSSQQMKNIITRSPILSDILNVFLREITKIKKILNERHAKNIINKNRAGKIAQEIRRHPEGVVSDAFKSIGNPGAPWRLHGKKLYELTKLNLCDKGLKAAHMKILSILIASGALTKLTFLGLGSNQIGDDGVTVLAGVIATGSLGALKELSLRGNDIGDVGMTEFSRAISNGSLGALKELYLGRNKFGDTGMTELSRAIASGSLGSLKRLSLCGNQISDAGVTALAGAISSGSLGSLETLWLDQNQIGDKGMKAFAAASGSLGALEDLHLQGNKIGDAGMTSLAGAIASGSLPAIKQVVLSYNPGNDVPVKNARLSRAISSGSLRGLKALHFKKIGDAGMTELSRAISSGSLPSLQQIYLSRNRNNHPELTAACQRRGIEIKHIL